MKILLAIEDLEHASAICRTIVTQFQLEGTTVLVLHVLEPLVPQAPFEMSPGYAPELGAQKDLAESLVAEIATQLRAEGVQVETAVEVGDVRATILDEATRSKADLIVLGSQSRNGIQRFLLGSVAESVARHAACSVQIVRAPTA